MIYIKFLFCWYKIWCILRNLIFDWAMLWRHSNLVCKIHPGNFWEGISRFSYTLSICLLLFQILKILDKVHDRPSFFTLTDPIKKDLSTLINFNCLNTYWSSQIFCYLTLSVPEKLKNLIFEMPIITQTLNINNLRTTSAKSINLHTIRKLVEYSLKNISGKGNVYSCLFWDIAIQR